MRGRATSKNARKSNRRARGRSKSYQRAMVGKMNEEKEADAVAVRTGGICIPPHQMTQMIKVVQDNNGETYQRLSWYALKKSIYGLVNKANTSNIKNIIAELFSENLIRGRGLFCRSCMKCQMARPGFTDVYSALVAVVNSKFPKVGNLFLRRIMLQFKKAFVMKDKPQLLAATKFIAHLVNQQVAHDFIAMDLLTVLLVNPTGDIVEVAVEFVKECGAFLQKLDPLGLNGVFERFHSILHEGNIDKHVQFLIEGLFAIQKAKFKGFPTIRVELIVMEQVDLYAHFLYYEDDIDPETDLDVFKLNVQFLEDDEAYDNLKSSRLWEFFITKSYFEMDSYDADYEEYEEYEEMNDEIVKITDETKRKLVNLRRTIYLTIMSSVGLEEACQKLWNIKFKPGQEMILCTILVDCCLEERAYLHHFCRLAQRFCIFDKDYQEYFEECFFQQYSTVRHHETNKVPTIAIFFAHLLWTDALSWHVLSYIHLSEYLNESSRLFIKILFQILSEQLGIHVLKERLNELAVQESFESLFPKHNPENIRFSIDFFTSIGLGCITERLRENLKNVPRPIMQRQKLFPDCSSSSSSDD